MMHELVDNGALGVDVAQTYPFSSLADAHERVETGTSGNVVLRIR